MRNTQLIKNKKMSRTEVLARQKYRDNKNNNGAEKKRIPRRNE